jgi:putative ABC transport system ATP-binding protein
VALPLLLEGRQLSAVQEAIDEMLELVGLSHRRRHRPDQLSGGEMQRVAIARALVIRPKIVLADEPTGNLDSATGARIVELLSDSISQFGHSALLVTHDPDVAARADSIVTVSDGRVVGTSPGKRRR